MPVVTIRGLLGSGAPEIGKMVAERLHVDYVDRQIIGEVAARLRRKEQDVEDKEMPPGTLLGRIAEALGRSYGFEGVGLPPWEMPLDDAHYLQSLESVIKELAASGSIVLYGRGSQFILKDYPGALHVLVVAPLAVRVKHVMQDMKSNEEAARQEITRFDTSGREFIKRYFKAELEDPAHYDLVINTRHLNFDAAASVTIEALSFKDPSVSKQKQQ
ncbi:MAG: cytidylate kinase-like family protein [Chloroflexi bacterium]|nr:cytidylate kinase-like family protein [Chloroflexota bacterium]